MRLVEDAATAQRKDGLPAAGARGADDEPVTIAVASRLAGVHPNTVRRLIHRGELGALMVKGRHGDTWLVDAAELRRLVARPRRTAGGPEAVDDLAAEPEPEPVPEPEGAGKAWPPAGAVATAGAMPAPQSAAPAESVQPLPGEPIGPDVVGEPVGVARDAGDAEEAGERAGSRVSQRLALAVDLSMERAQALERYTHSLLAPLVDMLREREAALERREALVRHQAERIGRLERELELTRSQLAQAQRAAPPPERAWTGGPPATLVAPSAAPAPPAPSVAPAGAWPAPAPAPNAPPGAWPPAAPAGGPLDSEVVALSSQIERLRGDLGQIAGRLEEGAAVLQRHPAVPGTSAPPPGAVHAAGDGGAAAGGAGAGPAADPFAQAEAAIRELQQALAGAPPTSPSSRPADLPPVAAESTPPVPAPAPFTATSPSTATASSAATAPAPATASAEPPAPAAAATPAAPEVAATAAAAATPAGAPAPLPEPRRPWWRFW